MFNENQMKRLGGEDRHKIAIEWNPLEYRRLIMRTPLSTWQVLMSSRMGIDRNKMNEKRIFQIRNREIDLDLCFIHLTSITSIESCGPFSASTAAAWLMLLVPLVLWLCSLSIALISGSGAPANPMRNPVIA